MGILTFQKLLERRHPNGYAQNHARFYSGNAIIVSIVDKPVLVLNSNFEPLNVCGFERAIGLMVSGKAFLILNGRGMIKTPSTTYPIPSVIRLGHHVIRPRLKVALSRLEIFRRDNWKCQYCGGSFHLMTIDHVLPKHLGGQHTWANLVTACPACNHRKGGRTLKESGMVLQKLPKEPPGSANYLFFKYLNENTEWSGFLEGW